MFPLKNEEKKVEYLELIYDLVFVYMAGRNNALLSHIEGGFVSLDSFLAYPRIVPSQVLFLET